MRLRCQVVETNAGASIDRRSAFSARSPLHRTRAELEAYGDLIVRVAGCGDYFCELSAEPKNEIITRTECGAGLPG